jgi:hypothetical protein
LLERRFNSSLATSERLSHQRDDGEIFAEPGPSRSVLDTVGSEGKVEQEPRVVEVEGGSSEAEVLETGSEATAGIEREVDAEDGGKPDKVKKKPAMLSLGEARKLIPTMADLNLHPGDKGGSKFCEMKYPDQYYSDDGMLWRSGLVSSSEDSIRLCESVA